MSKKRHRERPAVDTQLVEIFEDLANVDEEIRLKAAQALLTNFVPEGRADGDQLNEILRRLIRGLCSGRKAARLGFSIALTEFLTELLGPKGRHVVGFQDLSGLIDTLKKQTHASGGISGQVGTLFPRKVAVLMWRGQGRAGSSIRAPFRRRGHNQVWRLVSSEY